MSVACQVIMEAMEKLAPRHLAEKWDNVGLLLGSPAQRVTNVLVTLDITQEVADQAIKDKVDLIISHHPLIFKPLTKLRTDLPQGKILASLLKADIAVYATHTNLDSALGGVNDVLAGKLQLEEIQPLSVSYTEKMYKLVVFVPETHLEVVRRAISEAGAGHVGNYSHCSFTGKGIGSFLPLEGAEPFIGKVGTLEYVEECRLETILPEKISRRVLKAMLKAHPYEEVAYDMYELLHSENGLGLGRIGRLLSSMTVVEFAAHVKRVLAIDSIRIGGPQDKRIKKIAVCGGSGASLLQKAIFAGADVLVTGDVKYHEAQEALAAGIVIVDAGHFATEQPVLPYVAQYLTTCNNKEKWAVNVKVDTINQDAFHIY